MARTRRGVGLLAVLSVALAASACSGASVSNQADVFLSVDVDGGSYAGTPEAGTLRLEVGDGALVLLGVSPEDFAAVGEASTVPGLMGEDSVNAVLVVDGRSWALELSGSAYSDGELTFTTATLDDLDGTHLANHANVLEAPSSGPFGSATLFVDPVTTTTCSARFDNDTPAIFGGVGVPLDAGATWEARPPGLLEDHSSSGTWTLLGCGELGYDVHYVQMAGSVTSGSMVQGVEVEITGGGSLSPAVECEVSGAPPTVTCGVSAVDGIPVATLSDGSS